MTKEIYARIEEQFKSRSTSNPIEFGKPNSRKYKDKQAEFFTGAMAALVAVVEQKELPVLPDDLKDRHALAMPPV